MTNQTPLDPNALTNNPELFMVASTHHFHGDECLCGFKSARSRDRTEHIMLHTLSVAQPEALPDDVERVAAALHGDNCPDFVEPGACCDCDWSSFQRMAEVAIEAMQSVAQPEPNPDAVEAMSRVMNPPAWVMIDRCPEDELVIMTKEAELSKAEKLAAAYMSASPTLAKLGHRAQRMELGKLIGKALRQCGISVTYASSGPNELFDVAGILLSEYPAIDPAQSGTVNSMLKDFINDRSEYITALKNTRGDESMDDYWRWSGHAEARRQLATKLGWTVPHNPGETTGPVEGQ